LVELSYKLVESVSVFTLPKWVEWKNNKEKMMNDWTLVY
jgi:hypothetical protein